ncbi:MAG: hypothetical protein C5B60_05785 [Chloroflexi bacterium]|nr:MAG: hypothetical protein C5B60_05785 [Chloroflexota bacterium]
MGMLPLRNSPPHWRARTPNASRDCARTTNRSSRSGQGSYPSLERHDRGHDQRTMSTRSIRSIRRRTTMRIHNGRAARFLRALPLRQPTQRGLLCAALLIAVTVADLFLMSQRQDMAMAGGVGMRPPDTAHTVVWLLTCRILPIASASAGSLVLLRMLQSARRQHAQTEAVLRPLLAQPSLAAPTRLAPLLQALQLEQRTLFIACELPVALCYGLLHPRLLLSSAALRGLSPAELEAVLRHELVHLRRRDPLRRLLLRAMTDALPLPALQDVVNAVPLAQELSADRAVLAAVGPEALSGALLKVGDAFDTLQAVPATSSHQERQIAIGAFSAIDARIDQILGTPIPGQAGAASIVLPALVLVLLASGPLLCLLLPFPTPLFWAAGVLAAVYWRRLRLLARRFAQTAR